MKQYLIIGGIIMLVVIVLLVVKSPSTLPLGSISDGQSYNSTTTKAFSWTNLPVLKTGSGTLGSVVLTGVAAGNITLYDATTSNVSLRTGQKATSTIYLGSVPNSAAAGTYTFDTTFNDGLLVDVQATTPTSTITWR